VQYTEFPHQSVRHAGRYCDGKLQALPRMSQPSQSTYLHTSIPTVTCHNPQHSCRLLRIQTRYPNTWHDQAWRPIPFDPLSLQSSRTSYGAISLLTNLSFSKINTNLLLTYSRLIPFHIRHMMKSLQHVFSAARVVHNSCSLELGIQLLPPERKQLAN